MTSDDGPGRELVQDPLGITLARYSPDASQIVYVHAIPTTPGKLPSVAIVEAASGSTLRVIQLPGMAIGSVLNIGWRSSKRLWIEGHLTPSASLYDEIDASSGEITKEIPGILFSISPDGEHLIWQQSEIHFAPHCECIVAFLDEKQIYESRKGEKHSKVSEFLWSPDNRHCAFIDRTGVDDKTSEDATYSLVVVSVDHSEPATFRLTGALSGLLVWKDNQTIVVYGRKSYIVDLKTRTVSERPAALAPSNDHSLIDRGKLFTIEDRRCAPDPASPQPLPGGRKSG